MFKERIVKLEAYHPQVAPCDLVLDANESYVNSPYNRYPDPTATDLRQWFSKKHKLSADQIIVGNGSSEMIDLIMKCTLDPNDKVMTFGPTFSIYELNARILGAETLTYPLSDEFRLDVKGFIKEMETSKPQLVILCNPNNPTGTLLATDEIERILKSAKGAVVVDEAYIDFGGDSMLKFIDKYPQLIVLRTLSKAYGLAGARVGYLVSTPENVAVINKVRPPYNLSSIAQQLALSTLEGFVEMERVIEEIIEERTWLMAQLGKWTQPYPSGGNFIFFKTDKDTLYEALVEKGIRIRRYSGSLNGYYRLTIGRSEENRRVVSAMEEIFNE